MMKPISQIRLATRLSISKC